MNILFPDSLGDWRIETAVRDRGDQDVPPEQVSGDGVLKWEMTHTSDQLYGPVGFPTPQPIALVLDIALFSAMRAKRARKDVAYPHISDSGSKTAEADQMPKLYEYFEQCMVSAFFAFQSVELFVNHNIRDNVKEPVTIRWNNKKRTLTPDQLEGSLSTDEKLSQVLPLLFHKNIDARSDLWKRYTNLKELRNSIVHVKTKAPVQGKRDEDSVYYRCLNIDPIEFPLAGVLLMRFFVSRGHLRWLDVSEDYLKAIASTW